MTFKKKIKKVQNNLSTDKSFFNIIVKTFIRTENITEDYKIIESDIIINLLSLDAAWKTSIWLDHKFIPVYELYIGQHKIICEYNEEVESIIRQCCKGDKYFISSTDFIRKDGIDYINKDPESFLDNIYKIYLKSGQSFICGKYCAMKIKENI